MLYLDEVGGTGGWRALGDNGGVAGRDWGQWGNGNGRGTVSPCPPVSPRSLCYPISPISPWIPMSLPGPLFPHVPPYRDSSPYSPCLQVPPQRQCLSFGATQDVAVGQLQPAMAVIYDYYEPGGQGLRGWSPGRGRVCSDPAFCPTQLGAAPSSTAPPAGAALWPPSAPRKSANVHKVGPMSPRPGGPPTQGTPPYPGPHHHTVLGTPTLGSPSTHFCGVQGSSWGLGGVTVGFRRHQGNGGTWGPGKWRNTGTWRTRRELESRYRGAMGGELGFGGCPVDVRESC